MGSDGLAEGMFAQALQCTRKAQKIRVGAGSESHRASHARATFRERARFVKGDLGDVGKALECVARPHEEAPSRGVPDCGHDGRGRRKHQGARTEDDENRDGAHDFARHEPGACGRNERPHDDPGRPAVGEPNDLGASRIGALHEFDEAVHGAFFADVRRAHDERSEAVDRAAQELVARLFVDGHRLARHDGFVDGGGAFQKNAVGRNLFARQHADEVAREHVARRDDGLDAVAYDARLLGRKLGEFRDARAGLFHGEFFKKRADRHDPGDFARGEGFADHDRRDERHGNEDVRLDVKAREETFRGLLENRKAAENNGDPGGIEGKRRGGGEETQRKGDAGDEKKEEGSARVGVDPVGQFEGHDAEKKNVYLYPHGYCLEAE